MKLSDFDFRVWNYNSSEYLKSQNGYLALIKEGRGVHDYDRVLDVSNDCSGHDHPLYQYRDNINIEIELWTGFSDCKRNKIYEGDILKDNDHPTSDLLYEVVFKWGSFYLVEIGKNDEDLISEFLYTKLEVIGNIHENPELLK